MSASASNTCPISPEVKYFHSPDLLVDWSAGGVPADPESFKLLVEMSIGVKGDERGGADLFQIVVCSPDQFPSRAPGFFDRRHVLIFSRFDRKLIEATLIDRVEQCRGHDWEEVARKINVFAGWEFDSYRP
jgi:hypothetical protein